MRIRIPDPIVNFKVTQASISTIVRITTTETATNAETGRQEKQPTFSSDTNVTL